MNYGTLYFGGSGNLGGGTGTSTKLLLPARFLVGPSLYIMGPTQTTPNVAAVSTANTAYVMPFYLPNPAKLIEIIFETGASAGTVDVGVYSDLGNQGITASRIFSQGAVAPAVGVNIVSVPGITLAGGDQRYFVALTGSTVTTLSIMGWSLNPSPRMGLCFGTQVAGAGPTLGAALTLATVTNTTNWPLLGLGFKEV